jgi:hypothetical protein
LTIERATLRRSWAATPPPGSREITRAEAERLLLEAGTIMPSPNQLRRALLRPA